MDDRFVKIGDLWINLSRVNMCKDYPDARELLIVFSDQQNAEVLGGPERQAMLQILEGRVLVAQ